MSDPRWNFAPERWPDDDLVGVGADLEPTTILDAYRLGAFPMPHAGELCWWSPLERGVLRPGGLRITRSLRKSRRRFTVTLNESFAEVIDACADPTRAGAWIDDAIRCAYLRLHELGWAYSVETRDVDGTLVGGLYGLAIGELFAGESMFHRATDASKVALWALTEWVGPGWIDVQWPTDHLRSLGIESMARPEYRRLVADLVTRPRPAVFDQNSPATHPE